MKNRNIFLLSTWGIVFITFLIIAVVCIGFIFSPVKEYYKNNLNQELTEYSFGALGMNNAMYESWRENPNYIVGLGTAAFLSFSGAVFSVYMIERLRREKTLE